MPDPEFQLGNLPVTTWINRRVLVKQGGYKGHGSAGKGFAPGGINCLLVSVDFRKGTAEVKPMGHKKTETVPLTSLKPYWTKSPDLAALRPKDSNP